MKLPDLAKRLAFVGALLMVAGCATKISRPETVAAPAKVRFSEFSVYVMNPIVIAPDYARADANIKATRKIKESLVKHTAPVLPGMRMSTDAGVLPEGRVLRIEPHVREIKFIGGAARFWVGAMAGSSAVLMKVNFVDAATGEVVAEPEFHRSAGAFSGGMYGVADNMMLDEVARDIAQYIQFNR